MSGVERGLPLVPACRCVGQASGQCSGCSLDLAEVEEHYDDGDNLWCSECVPRSTWRDGRAMRPGVDGICVHGVGVSTGFWCSGCNQENAEAMGIPWEEGL